MKKIRSTFTDRRRAAQFFEKMHKAGRNPVDILIRHGVKTKYVVEYEKGWI